MSKSITDKRSGEEIEGNNPFFQLYRHNIKIIRQTITENPMAARLFMFLVENMDNKNAILISQKALEEALDVSIRSVQMAVKYLTDREYIMVLKSGTSNVYCVNADIVWTQRADKKKYAKFEAKVYLTASEQNLETQAKIQLQTEYQKVATVKEKECFAR